MSEKFDINLKFKVKLVKSFKPDRPLCYRPNASPQKCSLTVETNVWNRVIQSIARPFVSVLDPSDATPDAFVSLGSTGMITQNVFPKIIVRHLYYFNYFFIFYTNLFLNFRSSE